MDINISTLVIIIVIIIITIIITIIILYSLNQFNCDFIGHIF